MGRGIRATNNEIAVSAKTRETAINTEQTLDTTMAFSLGDIINLIPRREDDSNEANGYEEASRMYDRGRTAEWAASVEKATPQHFAFLLAYALGSVSTAAAGTGYEHSITPIAGDLDGSRDNPSFTAAQKFGETVETRRYASMFVDSLTATFARDAWIKLAAKILGTGKVTKDTLQETVNSAGTSVSLTLAANGVAGSSATERLANVQQIVAEVSPGVWTEVVYSAVSGASPAVITITAPAGGGAGLIDFKILYRPTASAWMTFPAREIEDVLTISEMTLTIGGTWTGSAFSGGRSYGNSMKSLEWSLNNNGSVNFLPGAGGAYAGKYSREARSQSIKLDREFQETIVQNLVDENETIGIYIKAEGAVFDTPHKYQVEIIFPQVGIKEAPISVDGKKLAESVTLVPYDGATYGSVIVKVKNKVATYAA